MMVASKIKPDMVAPTCDSLKFNIKLVIKSNYILACKSEDRLTSLNNSFNEIFLTKSKITYSVMPLKLEAKTTCQHLAHRKLTLDKHFITN